MAEDTEIKTPEQIHQEAAHEKIIPTAGDAADLHFRKGINKERARREARFETELARYNVKPVRDDKGRIDEAASLAALVKAGQPEAAAALEQRYAGRIAELSSQNERLNQELQQTRIRTTVREKITLMHPLNVDDASDLFLMRYNIKLDDETGEFQVCDRQGNPLHHKITAEPLTVQDAVEQFFNERPGLRELNKGNGLQGLGSLKGAPRETSNDNLRSQLEEALANGDEAKATAIKNEMKKRIRAGAEV